MKLNIALVGAIFATAASAIAAPSISPIDIGIAIANTQTSMPPEKWEAEKDVPYALWDARSLAAPGTEIEVNNRGGLVDSAELLPQAVYATDKDLSDGQRVILPKGGLLIKMAGADGNWYCTWRYGDKAAASTGAITENERELCVEADALGHTTNARLFPAALPAVMTLTHGLSEKRLKQVSSVNLDEVDRMALPPRTQVQVLAAFNARDGGIVCLGQLIAPLRLGRACFPGVGRSISLGGGRYTLTSLAPDHTFKIKIDESIDAKGIAPHVID